MVASAALGRFLRNHLGHRAPARRLLGDPQFSVIMATLNPGAKLQATLDSVLSQSGVSLELVVIDGGSKDGTLEILKQYPDKVRLISEPERGVYTALNRGIAEARGEIFYFLGAGDRLRESALKKVAEAWPGSRYAMLYGNVWMEDLGILYDGEFDKEKLRRTNICHQGMFYSRGTLVRHGPYDLRYPILSDYDLNLKVFGDPRTKVKFIPETIADYEGAGLSAGTRDELFQAEKKELCLKRLGPKPKVKKPD